MPISCEQLFSHTANHESVARNIHGGRRLENKTRGVRSTLNKPTVEGQVRLLRGAFYVSMRGWIYRILGRS